MPGLKKNGRSRGGAASPGTGGLGGPPFANGSNTSRIVVAVVVAGFEAGLNLGLNLGQRTWVEPGLNVDSNWVEPGLNLG